VQLILESHIIATLDVSSTTESICELHFRTASRNGATILDSVLYVSIKRNIKYASLNSEDPLLATFELSEVELSSQTQYSAHVSSSSDIFDINFWAKGH
jgi:hypothetical protein